MDRGVLNLQRGALLTAMILLLVSPIWAGPKYRVLHAFGKGADGGGLWSPVALDGKGNLYGATSGGGPYGYGIVFMLVPRPNGSWIETVLHSFKNGDPGGSEPNGGLILDGVGNIYGTATAGGAHHSGVVFELRRGSNRWTESVLHNFCSRSGCEDGGSPSAGVIWDKAGGLLGTAADAFELTSSSSGWKETVLHRFGIKKGDGVDPFAGLILDTSGNIFGTTQAGGIGCGGGGCGTVYELAHTSSGWKETVLYSFNNNGTDGYTPGNGALIIDASGHLYGTTAVGGTGEWGTVFQLKRIAGRWKETIVYNFTNGPSGGFPAGGVVMDKAGNLYGTTISGGTSSCDCGVIYKLSPESKGRWTYTVLHRFTGNDGAQPAASLILDNRGNLYGTTPLGGANGAGVVFELTP
jgi:uncharacterized repeat protein (TIGR03803 family)